MSTQELYAGDYTVFPPEVTLLDLIGDVSIPSEFKVADVRDIEKRGSGFTQEWVLPGTPINNQFFGGLHDINADFTAFNPNVRTQCKFLLDGEEIIDGYLQLKSINRNKNGDITYTVTLFDLTGGFFQSIRGKKVRDIDLTKLDHILNLANVKNSWDTTWDKNHLGVAGAGDGDNGGYFYPLLQDDYAIQPRPIEHFQQSIYYKRVLDEMIKQAHPNYPTEEYTWSGDLFDDVDFEREGLPYNGDSPKVSEAIANSKTMFVGRGSDILMKTHMNADGSLGDTTVAIALDDEATAPFDDSNNLWDGSEFVAPSTGLYKFAINFGIDVEVDYLANSGAAGYDPVDREIKHRSILNVEVRDGGGNLVNPNIFNFFGFHAPYGMTFEPGNNVPSLGAELNRYSSKLTDMSTGAHTDTLSIGLPNASDEVPGIEEAGSIYMQAGWTVKLSLFMSADTVKKWGTTTFGGIGTGMRVTEVRYKIKEGSSFKSHKFQNSYADGELLNTSDFIDKNLTQRNLLADLVARKNCIIYTNPANENDIKFDYRDEFFSRGITIDMTELIEEAVEDKITMIGELQNEEIILSYKKSGDIYNKEYIEKSDGDIYGQQRVIFGNEFVKGVKRIESPFEPTPFVRIGLGIINVFPTPNHESTALVPAIKVNAPKIGPRVLHMKKGLLTDDVSVAQDGTVVKFQIQYKDVNGALQIDEITGYPYAGHYDHPINPTLDINFGVLPFVLAEMPLNAGNQWQPTPNTESARRWTNTLEQIAEGRMRTSKVRIVPSLMHLIRNNPNANVFIENTYYYINKVLFEANQNLTKLAVIELITVEDSLKLPLDTPNFGGTFQDFKGDDHNSGTNPNDNPNTKPEVFRGNTTGKNNKRLEVKGAGNIVGSDTEGTKISGDGNFINSGTKNAVIENGNNNQIYADNVTIKNADNLVVTTDGVSIDGNTITLDGKTEILFNKIDGGQNELRNENATSEINKVEGAVDGLSDPFNTNSIFNKIDSDTGITKEI